MADETRLVAAEREAALAAAHDAYINASAVANKAWRDGRARVDAELDWALAEARRIYDSAVPRRTGRWPMPEQLTGVDKPHAEVVRVGRWTWRVVIINGFMTCGPDGYGWHVRGERRAYRKAERELKRYLVAQSRRASQRIVNADGSITYHTSPAE